MKFQHTRNLVAIRESLFLLPRLIAADECYDDENSPRGGEFEGYLRRGQLTGEARFVVEVSWNHKRRTTLVSWNQKLDSKCNSVPGFGTKMLTG